MDETYSSFLILKKMYTEVAPQHLTFFKRKKIDFLQKVTSDIHLNLCFSHHLLQVFIINRLGLKFQ